MSRPRLRGNLATRIVLAQALIIVPAAVVAGVLASVVGERLFHGHLVEEDHALDYHVLEHLEEVYRNAAAISLLSGLGVSLLVAAVVGWFSVRWVRGQLSLLADAASEVAERRFGARAPELGLIELDEVARSFNSMADRLGEVDATRRRVLSDLGHELRTPIATLTAYHDGLRDGVVQYGPAVASVLDEQVARLTRLAADLKDVMTVEEAGLSLALQPVALGSVAANQIAAVADTFAAAGVRLSLQGEATVDGDPVRLGQLVANLLSNALRHTPRGGDVRVEVEETDESSIELRVTDTGDGLTSEQAGQVFERFWRSDRARSRDQGGSGIGLSIAKAIAEAHGGTLRAHSEGLGKGARFTLVLPRRGGGSTVAQSGS